MSRPPALRLLAAGRGASQEGMSGCAGEGLHPGMVPASPTIQLEPRLSTEGITGASWRGCEGWRGGSFTHCLTFSLIHSF